MNEQLDEKKLESVTFRAGCHQNSDGIRHNTEKSWETEQLYIHQIVIKRDIKDRYEPLYSIKYDDYIFNETKLIKNRTFSELVNFIYKQKVITEKSFTEYILSNCITYKHADIVNGIEFVKKEKHDFEEEDLPRKKI